jgi:hypothetical protein
MTVKVFRIVLAAGAFPFFSFGDVPSRPPGFSSKVDTARVERQRDEAEKNYRRGVQFAEGDGVANDYSAAAQLL